MRLTVLSEIKLSTLFASVVKVTALSWFIPAEKSTKQSF